MHQQDNTPANLKNLWILNKITVEQYFFRLKANELNIKTFTKIN